MATSYPGGVDAFTNPTATDSLNSATVPHATQHANANDAIEAIETELGTNPSGASATVAARFDVIEAAGWVTSTRILDGTIVDGDINASAAIDQSKIANLTTGLAAKAPLASPTFTGTPSLPTGTTAVTQSQADNSTKLATTAYVDTGLGGRAPSPCLWLPGSSGNYVSCADAGASFDVTDLDVRVKVALTDWTPASDVCLISRWAGGGAAGDSFYLRIRTTGVVDLQYSDGGTQRTRTSTVSTGITDGSAKWVRCTLDVDDGSSQNIARFYLSDDGASWTQLGADVVTAGTTTLNPTNLGLNVGMLLTSTFPMTGKLYQAQLLSGIDGSIVANYRADVPSPRYRDSAGVLWTVQGTANGWSL